MATARIIYHDPMSTTLIALRDLRQRAQELSQPSAALERRPRPFQALSVRRGPLLLLTTVALVLYAGSFYYRHVTAAPMPERVAAWLAAQPAAPAGDAQGVWALVDEELAGSGPLVAGLRVGQWRFTTADGRLAGVGAFDAAGSGGVWTWNARQQPASFHLYDRGELREIQYFHPGGGLAMSVACERGVRHGELRCFDAAGACVLVGHYEHGVRQGEWRRHDGSGGGELLCYRDDCIVARRAMP